MTGWTRWERRWRDAVLAAMLPAGERLSALVVDDDFWDELARAAPRLLRVGLRVAVWALTFAPLFVVGRPRLFARLSPEDQDRVLVRLARSRRYLVRQLVVVVKLVACLARFGDARTRRLVGS